MRADGSASGHVAVALVGATVVAAVLIVGTVARLSEPKLAPGKPGFALVKDHARVVSP